VLGYNAAALFGAAQFAESWHDDSSTDSIHGVRGAFVDLLQRRLRWPSLHARFTASGGEALALAVEYCQQTRPWRVDRVITIGEIEVAHVSTSSSRLATVTIPYPAMSSDDVARPVFPEGWLAHWALLHPAPDTAPPWRRQDGAGPPDEWLDSECHTLELVRAELAGQSVAAVVVPSMLVEAGDQYSSLRFHAALQTLCSSRGVPLVYDERQTAPGLGRTFFWHDQLAPSPADGPAVPDIVVCGSRAGIGIVLARHPIDGRDTGSARSLCRAYIQASMVDQFEDQLPRIERRVRDRLGEIRQSRPPVDGSPNPMSAVRACGMALAIDWTEPEACSRFAALALASGVVVGRQRQQTTTLRFNLSCRDDDIDHVFAQLGAAFQEIIRPPATTSTRLPTSDRSAEPPGDVRAPESYYNFHRAWIGAKLAMGRAGGQTVTAELASRAIARVEAYLDDELDALGMPRDKRTTVVLTRESYRRYRNEIARLQREVYEPVRQTPLDKFDALFAAPHHMALAVEQSGRIVGMGFAAPLVNFPGERGVTEDRWFHDERTLYALDVTVVDEFRGGLGRAIKQALVLYATWAGFAAIHGRNRDHLARGMWAINLSLGSYELEHRRDDYPDDQPFRDCIYYRCPLQWPTPPDVSTATIDDELVRIVNAGIS